MRVFRKVYTLKNVNKIVTQRSGNKGETSFASYFLPAFMFFSPSSFPLLCPCVSRFPYFVFFVTLSLLFSLRLCFRCFFRTFFSFGFFFSSIPSLFYFLPLFFLPYFFPILSFSLSLFPYVFLSVSLFLFSSCHALRCLSSCEPTDRFSRNFA